MSSLEISSERVAINDMGYDRRGRYFGVGLPVFRVSIVNVEHRDHAETYVRAFTKAEAKDKVVKSLLTKHFTKR